MWIRRKNNNNYFIGRISELGASVGENNITGPFPSAVAMPVLI
jgi:hypothetical protein